MTRREWLNRVVGATVAAAVAPLVDLTDMTPAFWQQPALREVLPWRITFPDGLSWAFNAVVTQEEALPDGTVQLTLKPEGVTQVLSREVSFRTNYLDAPLPGTCALPPAGWFCTLEAGHGGPCPTHPLPQAEEMALLPSPHAPATVISRNGEPVGELKDIGVPILRRAPLDVFSDVGGDADTHVLGLLKREPITFTVEFK